MKNKIRYITQIIFLVLIGYVAIRPLFDNAYLADFESYCPFGGISSLFSKLNQSTMACNMSETQVFLGLSLLLAAGFIGKLFCSFVCPIGSVSEWIGRLGDKLKLRREINKTADKYLRILKYALLFVTIYFTMTTSELFCKEYDPYFAVVNLFNNADIELLYAIPALAITIAGALFFRLFWCKYLCPLGALTNIFMNLPLAGGIIIVFIVLNLFGVGYNFIWLLAALVTAGMLNEIVFMKSFFLPVPKIARLENSCSSCGFCDDNCPQGINISEYEKVRHIDCNLCTDCVYSCPLKNTLSVNKKKNLNYLSPVALVIFIIIGFVASAYFEFSTISVKWGKSSGDEAVYTRSGLKNVKCYGSSMSLAGSLEHIEGIIGLETYASSHTVKVFYDPSIITEKKVAESLFNPVKEELIPTEKIKNDSVSVLEVGIFGLFDKIDFNNLYYTLNQKNGIYGFEAYFGEPVIAVIYYDSKINSPEEIISQIEKPSVLIKFSTGTEEIKPDFKVEKKSISKKTISLPEYKKKIFFAYDDHFNNYNDYSTESLSVYQFHFPDAGNSEIRGSLEYLASHLSGFEGIVRFRTIFEESCYGLIYFDRTVINPQQIQAALKVKEFVVYLTDTETEKVKNPFSFDLAGKVVNAESYKY